MHNALHKAATTNLLIPNLTSTPGSLDHRPPHETHQPHFMPNFPSRLTANKHPKHETTTPK
ncbi:hypothetical protein N431DRAFT_434646 [Stipitochalara longipes BDJ]|nr:hypothetical protein N431DRAFT_434646 [Stipitochalara longipes BDJ]